MDKNPKSNITRLKPFNIDCTQVLLETVQKLTVITFLAFISSTYLKGLMQPTRFLRVEHDIIEGPFASEGNVKLTTIHNSALRSTLLSS